MICDISKCSELHFWVTFKSKQLYLWLRYLRKNKKEKRTSHFVINLFWLYLFIGFPGGSVVKNSPAIQETAEDMGFDHWAWKIPGEGDGIPSSILAWEILWTEEPGRLRGPWGHERVWHNLATKQQKYIYSSQFHWVPAIQ